VVTAYDRVLAATSALVAIAAAALVVLGLTLDNLDLLIRLVFVLFGALALFAIVEEPIAARRKRRTGR
jgi:uncharacterized membrane protein